MESLSRSLTWLSANRDQFALSLGNTSIDRLLLLKPFSEFVFALSVLQQYGVSMQTSFDWAWAQVDEGVSLLNLLAIRPDLVDLLGLCSNFAANGFVNNRLSAWIGRLLKYKSVCNSEMAHWNMVSLRWAEERMKGCVIDPKHLNHSWLKKCPEPWMIGDAHIYAVTHNVFYLTDLGSRPDALGEPVTEYLKLWLPVWIRSFEAENHLDLVGELIMSLACIGEKSLGRRMQENFFLKQRIDGSYPGPIGAGRSLMNQSSSPERNQFLQDYHTTLVGAIAAAMLS